MQLDSSESFVKSIGRRKFRRHDCLARLVDISVIATTLLDYAREAIRKTVGLTVLRWDHYFSCLVDVPDSITNANRRTTLRENLEPHRIGRVWPSAHSDR